MKSIWDDVVSSLREAGYVVETREEAASREQETARLRRFERDAWIAMENHVARLEVFDAYARALREHEAHKGDPSRSVATGAALYAAEAAMRKFAMEET